MTRVSNLSGVMVSSEFIAIIFTSSEGGTWTKTWLWLIYLRQSIDQRIFPTSTGAAWRKQEPIHENSSTFSLIRVVSQKPMPFVLLLTTAVPRTSECPWYSGKKHVLKEFILKSYKHKLFIYPTFDIIHRSAVYWLTYKFPGVLLAQTAYCLQ